MGLTDNLRAKGFKPEANVDGEFKPLKGTYACEITVLRPEVDEKNNGAKYYQVEYKPKAVLEGDPFGDKFSFRKRVYVDGDKAEDNLQAMLDDLFTCGIELDMSSDDAMEASFTLAIGKTAYIRAWGWTPDKDRTGNAIPESDRKAFQQFVVQKQAVAEKRRNSTALPF